MLRLYKITNMNLAKFIKALLIKITRLPQGVKSLVCLFTKILS